MDCEHCQEPADVLVEGTENVQLNLCWDCYGLEKEHQYALGKDHLEIVERYSDD